MAFDFATPVERRHPSGNWPSQKWHRYGDEVLPLWVADMDFVSPPAVREALRARVDHGVFGYGLVPDSLRETLCAWSREHYGWEIAPEWQQWLPGVVPALHLASLALTAPGDGVLTVTPIYPPFLRVAERTGRTPQQARMGEPAGAGPALAPRPRGAGGGDHPAHPAVAVVSSPQPHRARLGPRRAGWPGRAGGAP